MPDTQEMRRAIGQWLEARAKYYTGGVDSADAYCAAGTRLLAAFAADWAPDDPSMFATAYQNFRAALVASSPPLTTHQI
jgi:hypothetical protein